MKKLNFSALIVALFFLAASCSDKTTFQRSELLPAAEGEIDIDQDNNGNYRIDIDIENMARASSLTPARNVYVVWAKSDNDEMRNLGSLQVDKNLNAELTAVTPYKPKEIIITAEDNSTTSYPSNQVALRSNGL